MKTSVLHVDQDDWLKHALATLEGGGLVAFPTDTVYGLGAKATIEDSVRQLFEVKERDQSKPIPLLLNSAEALSEIALDFSQMAERFAHYFWPGPLTMVVRRRTEFAYLGGEQETVGARVPDHRIALTLLAGIGPLAVTSANLSGEPNTRTAQETYGQLSGRIDLIIDGGETPGGMPSTVVDCTGDHPVILREGPITMEDLLSNPKT
jgi:tRNA threonylcarbamoyl adenosine modification protein (Sua5/YciO/YrdC/YwlC family)